jgi:molybdopterin converting factor small subunit
MAQVVLPRSLVALFPASDRRYELEASTVAELIDRLDERVPGMRNRLVDAGPTIRTHLNVFVDGALATLATPVAETSVVHVIPAVSGG